MACHNEWQTVSCGGRSIGCESPDFGPFGRMPQHMIRGPRALNAWEVFHCCHHGRDVRAGIWIGNCLCGKRDHANTGVNRVGADRSGSCASLHDGRYAHLSHTNDYGCRAGHTPGCDPFDDGHTHTHQRTHGWSYSRRATTHQHAPASKPVCNARAVNATAVPLTSKPPVVPPALADLARSQALSNRNPDAAATIARLAWVSDGMDELETQGAQALVDLALGHELVFDGMIRKSWVADGMTAAEASIVGDLKPIADQ